MWDIWFVHLLQCASAVMMRIQFEGFCHIRSVPQEMSETYCCMMSWFIAREGTDLPKVGGSGDDGSPPRDEYSCTRV